MMLEWKMDAVGRLAGRVSHDLNNLITVGTLCCDRLQEYLPPGVPGRLELEELQRTLQRGLVLARQLVTASLQEPVDLVAFDLRDLAAEGVRLIRPTLGPGVEVRISVPDNAVTIRADRAQLAVSLVNLLLNARDAMADGGSIAVHVRLDGAVPGPDEEAEAEGPEYALLTVEDEGAGIPPEALPHIFEPFFSTRPKGKGIGLGLTTVYAAVRQAGGNIAVETVPGRGTRFVLRFPPGSDATTPAAKVERESPTGCALVVDDDEEVRIAVRRALEEVGYPVIEAASGEQAVALVSGSGMAPALLITDIVMPGMYGTELADRILADHPGTRVLFMSGFSGQGFNLGRFQIRGAEWLRKPFEPVDLVKAVAQVMNRQVPAGD